VRVRSDGIVAPAGVVITWIAMTTREAILPIAALAPFEG
jgi:hypothetical protein